jgi:GTP-binding protein
MEFKFVKSSNDYKTCPPVTYPEFAFIGRSNVGKSSLINMLAGVKNLAKISSRPGKTQLINHFLVENTPTFDKQNSTKVPVQKPWEANWYLVDLPGYGYARTSKSSIEHFQELIKGYIVTRPSLHCLFVLIDSRLEPQKIDLEFLEFLGQFQVPFVLVFTKTDKISSNAVQSNINKFRKAMLQTWDSMPQIFTSSIIEKNGKEEILSFIESTINATKKK